MAEEKNKVAARNQERSPDKSLARRERQAQALRQNLVRRKAQMRDRRKDEPSQG
jgi:hypothetical protein